MKKKIIVLLCVIISFISSFAVDEKVFLVDSKNMISILLTLLGLCFTSFSFISNSISNALKKNKNPDIEKVKLSLNKMLKSIEENIFLIFYLSIILIIINLINNINMPLIQNPVNIDFGLFKILSLKSSIMSFFTSLVFCLAVYAFYDLLRATFKLLKNDYE